MRDRFPPLEPYESGMLDVPDGHRLYWECCGNPNGKAALFLHGGPGSGCTAGQRRFFDPKVYRAVLFDQRGAGRSRPLASDASVDLGTNTTTHLIADIERLREHCGIERWVVLGMSWGTTLGLAYAQAHPQRFRALVLALVTTTSRREVEWLTRGVGRLFPEQWERFAAAVPAHLRHLSLVDAYATLLSDPDPLVREHGARAWCAWEDAHVSLTPGHRPNPRFNDPEFRLRFARLVTHYWRHAAFLAENQLLRDAAILNGIPGVLIHGRYDVSSPLETAWQLSKNWATSRLCLLANAGHGGGETFVDAIVRALGAFASGKSWRAPLPVSVDPNVPGHPSITLRKGAKGDERLRFDDSLAACNSLGHEVAQLVVFAHASDGDEIVRTGDAVDLRDALDLEQLFGELLHASGFNRHQYDGRDHRNRSFRFTPRLTRR